MNLSTDLRSFVLLALMLTLAGLDQTILATALSTIALDLHRPTGTAAVFSAYLASSTAVMLLYGRMADRFGVKPMLLTAFGLFLAGSAACTGSQSFEQLIVGRALQGLGGGGLMALAMTTVAVLYAPALRGRFLGLLGSLYGLSTLAGPLVGGVLVQYLSWRWAFLINLPAGALVWWLLVRWLHTPAGAHRGDVDYLGAALLGAALAVLMLGTQRYGGEAGDGSAALFSPWLASVLIAVLTALWWWRQRRATAPILPVALSRKCGFATFLDPRGGRPALGRCSVTAVLRRPVPSAPWAAWRCLPPSRSCRCTGMQRAH